MYSNVYETTIPVNLGFCNSWAEPTWEPMCRTSGTKPLRAAAKAKALGPLPRHQDDLKSPQISQNVTRHTSSSSYNIIQLDQSSIKNLPTR